jgi:hypothetical protein
MDKHEKISWRESNIFELWQRMKAVQQNFDAHTGCGTYLDGKNLTHCSLEEKMSSTRFEGAWKLGLSEAYTGKLRANGPAI